MKFRRPRKKFETEPSLLPQQYINEAARSGSEEKVREGFARKLARIATDNPVINLAREAYRYMTDPKLPARYKVMLVAALLYFLAPIDAVPDAIPGLGYVDNVMVLSAIVASIQKLLQAVRDNAKEVIREGEEAAEWVVNHALSEARETWARRGVAQFALCLWGSMTAAFVSLIYYVTKKFILESHASMTVDPFSWAVIAAACLGFFIIFSFSSGCGKSTPSCHPTFASRWPMSLSLSWIGAR
jgi:uncharacterized membrane protein YkvA (DUF1232 family)